MASIKITVSRGGYTSKAFGGFNVGAPDLIEIDVPVPDRADVLAGGFMRPSEYVQLLGTTFDKTAELVEVVRGHDDVIEAEIADDEEGAA